MPTFTLTAHCAAPVEEVWKLVHDPHRFPEWWAGIETVAALAPAGTGATTYTMWPEGYPDFPMEQVLRATPGVVTISCLVSDLEFCWQLAETAPGPDDGTDISVLVTIPEAEAHRLEAQQDVVAASLSRLSEIAASA